VGDFVWDEDYDLEGGNYFACLVTGINHADKRIIVDEVFTRGTFYQKREMSCFIVLDEKTQTEHYKKLKSKPYASEYEYYFKLQNVKQRVEKIKSILDVE